MLLTTERFIRHLVSTVTALVEDQSALLWIVRSRSVQTMNIYLGSVVQSANNLVSLATNEIGDRCPLQELSRFRCKFCRSKIICFEIAVFCKISDGRVVRLPWKQKLYTF